MEGQQQDSEKKRPAEVKEEKGDTKRIRIDDVKEEKNDDAHLATGVEAASLDHVWLAKEMAVCFDEHSEAAVKLAAAAAAATSAREKFNDMLDHTRHYFKFCREGDTYSTPVMHALRDYFESIHTRDIHNPHRIILTDQTVPGHAARPGSTLHVVIEQDDVDKFQKVVNTICNKVEALKQRGGDINEIGRLVNQLEMARMGLGVVQTGNACTKANGLYMQARRRPDEAQRRAVKLMAESTHPLYTHTSPHERMFNYTGVFLSVDHYHRTRTAGWTPDAGTCQPIDAKKLDLFTVELRNVDSVSVQVYENMLRDYAQEAKKE